MTYFITAEHRIEDIIDKLINHYKYTDLTINDKIEIRKTLQSVPEFVNFDKPLRGNLPFWALADLHDHNHRICQCILQYLRNKKSNEKTEDGSGLSIHVGVWQNMRHKHYKDMFIPPMSFKLTLRDVIYRGLMDNLIHFKHLYVIEIFEKYLKDKSYNCDFKQAFYDMMELHYADRAYLGEFGRYTNQFPVMLEISELLYNENSPYFHLSKRLDSLQINWRQIPNIKNCHPKETEEVIMRKIYTQETIDSFIKIIEDYIVEQTNKKYEAGSLTVKELIDEAEIKAGRLTNKWLFVSYAELITHVLTITANLTKDNLINILIPYIISTDNPNGLIGLEDDIKNYTIENLKEALNEIVYYLSKSQLLKIIENYSFSHNK